MDVLWDRGTPASVREVAEALPGRGLAYTTVMTVLDRLAGKGMVERERAGRAWSYQPTAAREAYIARLMLDALDLAGGDERIGRDAALVRFARSVTGTEAEVLRAALDDQAGTEQAGTGQGNPRSGTDRDGPDRGGRGPAGTDRD